MVQVRKRRPSSPAQAAKVTRAIDALLDPGLFKALSDGTRLRLLACLAKCGRPCSVGEVAQCCSVDLSVVSRHLAALEEAGVLAVSKEGRTVRYRVLFAETAGVLRALADALQECCPEGCGTGCEGGGCGPKPR
jgi:ArsR family transcriptional regulator